MSSIILNHVNCTAAVMIGVGICTAIELQIRTAHYGRYSGSDGSSKDATTIAFPQINARLAWMLQECPSFFGALMFSGFGSLAPTNRVLLSLFLLHYANRSFVYPLQIRPGHGVPVDIVAAAFGFCLLNGWLQGRAAAQTRYPDGWLRSPRCVVGVVLFFVGLGINMHSDAVLRRLRAPGETGYKIPQEGMFKYVSGANYFGEMVEWMGFAIASWSIPSLAFFVFVCSNIGPRAVQHHRWYKNKFGVEYPPDRKAVIPFIL